MTDNTKKDEKSKAGKKASSVISAGLPTEAYVKALPLRSLDDVDVVKKELTSGNILILRVSPLAKKSIEDVKRAINELCDFIESIGGDIARLGDERVVVTPSSIRIWRGKTAATVRETPTAA